MPSCPETTETRDVRMFVGREGNTVRIEIEIEDDRPQARHDATRTLLQTTGRLLVRQERGDRLILFPSSE